MGNFFSNIFFENDEKLEQSVTVEFNTNVPIVDVELKPTVSLSHIGPCIFRWFRINSEEEVDSLKSMVKVPEITLVSRALSYRPVSSDAHHQLLFFARLMKNSQFQESLTLFRPTVARPENVPLRNDIYNREFSLDPEGRNLKISCGTYCVDGDLFGEDIVAEEKIAELSKLYPAASPMVFNFLYRRNLLVKELNVIRPDILFLQRLNRKEHLLLKSKLFKEGYSCIQLWKNQTYGMITYFKRDKLTKVREYKIFLKKLHEYDPKKKEAQFMISSDSYELVERLCKDNGVEIKDLQFDNSICLLLELDLRSEYFSIPVKSANETQIKEITFFVLNLDFHNNELVSVVEMIIVLSFLFDLVQSCKRNYAILIGAANLIHPEVYDFIMKHVYKGKDYSKFFNFNDSYLEVFKEQFRYDVSRDPVSPQLTKDFIFYQKQTYFDLVKIGDIPKFQDGKDYPFPNVHYISSHISLVSEFAIQFPKKSKEQVKRKGKGKKSEELDEVDVSDFTDSVDEEKMEEKKITKKIVKSETTETEADDLDESFEKKESQPLPKEKVEEKKVEESDEVEGEEEEGETEYETEEES